jgi:membrane protease subunit (stomatin/prohibitin family)
MGFFDAILGQFIDVIEWTDSSSDTMVYRFERDDNEIKNGAKLTVRESQIAIFVNEGEIADIFEPGIYELTTRNLPILTTLKHWDHAFNSPFKAEVYFFNLRQFTNLKWGTKNPIMLRDREFGPLRIRAFGSYEIAIKDPQTFLKEIVGTDGYFTVDEISDQLRNLIVSRFATIVASMKIPILDLAANYESVGDFIEEKISPDFHAYGLELHNLLIENISLPPKVEEALDKRTSMGLAGDLDQYLKYQSAESLNSGGSGSSTAGDAMGMGMGFAMAQQMANSFSNNQTQPKTQQAPAPQPTPPPIPKAQTYHLAIDGSAKGPLTIEQIKDLYREKKITQESLAWREGMSAWQPIASLDELKRVFETLPPPLPFS